MISFSSTYTAIHRIVNHATRNEKKQCFFVNLTNNTFWTKTPNGAEILKFFTGMTISQIINFFGFFDIFVVGFHNGINGHLYMTADPSSPNFKKTIRFSISKGYKQLKKRLSGQATLSVEGDLRRSIGSTPVQSTGFESPSMESAFQQGLSTKFIPHSPIQCFGGPVIQPPSFGEDFRLKPIAQRDQVCSFFEVDSFASQKDFIPIKPANGPLHRERQFVIRKGRVVCVERVEIPSDSSSGPSTSSTVGGIAKSSKAQTPVSTTIANLEKKIARLEMEENLLEGSLNHSELLILRAKLKKIQNSL
jgi:hypothetical protein